MDALLILGEDSTPLHAKESISKDFACLFTISPVIPRGFKGKYNLFNASFSLGYKTKNPALAGFQITLNKRLG